MKTVSCFALLISAVLLVAPPARAQMVVDRNIGEQVDSLRYSVPYWQWQRHRNLRHARFVVLQPSFPTPQPFGWFNCCQ